MAGAVQGNAGMQAQLLHVLNTAGIKPKEAQHVSTHVVDPVVARTLVGLCGMVRDLRADLAWTPTDRAASFLLAAASRRSRRAERQRGIACDAADSQAASLELQALRPIGECAASGATRASPGQLPSAFQVQDEHAKHIRRLARQLNRRRLRNLRAESSPTAPRRDLAASQAQPPGLLSCVLPDYIDSSGVSQASSLPSVRQRHFSALAQAAGGEAAIQAALFESGGHDSASTGTKLHQQPPSHDPLLPGRQAGRQESSRPPETLTRPRPSSTSPKHQAASPAEAWRIHASKVAQANAEGGPILVAARRRPQYQAALRYGRAVAAKRRS